MLIMEYRRRMLMGSTCGGTLVTCCALFSLFTSLPGRNALSTRFFKREVDAVPLIRAPLLEKSSGQRELAAQHLGHDSALAPSAQAANFQTLACPIPVSHSLGQAGSAPHIGKGMRPKTMMSHLQRELQMDVKTEKIVKKHWYGTTYEKKLSISYTDVSETKSACQFHTPDGRPGCGPIYFSTSRTVDAGGDAALALGGPHLAPPSSHPSPTLEGPEEEPPPPVPKIQLGAYMKTYIDSSKGHQFLEFLKRKNAADGGMIALEDEYELQALNRYLLEFRNENKNLLLPARPDNDEKGTHEQSHEGEQIDEAMYDKMATAMVEQQTLPLQRQVKPQAAVTSVNDKNEQNCIIQGEGATEKGTPSIDTRSEAEKVTSTPSQAPSPLENNKAPNPNITFKQFTIVLKRRFDDAPEDIERFTQWIEKKHPESLGKVKETDIFKRWDLFYNYAIWVSGKNEDHGLKDHYGTVRLSDLATRLDRGAENFRLDEILDFMDITPVQRNYFEQYVEGLSRDYVAKNHSIYAIDKKTINKEFAPSQPWTTETVNDLYKLWKDSGWRLRYRIERSWEYIKGSWNSFVLKLKKWVSDQKAKCFQTKITSA